jgi:lysozyme
LSLIGNFLLSLQKNKKRFHENKLSSSENKKPKRISQKGIDLIKTCEGLRFRAYKDPIGVVTIGYGHTKTAEMGQIITEKQAEELLRADLRNFEEGVVSRVLGTLKQCEFDALVSFAFNVGLGNLGKSTLLKRVNMGNMDAAADEFLRWNRAGGKVLKGLTIRRKAERRLFLGEL